MTIKELMEKYSISRLTAYRWCRTGRVKSKKLGKRWYIVPDELDKENYAA